jgi:hypothetical protein
MSRITLAIAVIASFIACGESRGQASLNGFSPSDKGISAQERQALVALYEATDGNHWKNHDGWLGPAGSECSWYGVDCDPGTSEHATVHDLQLSENNLHGRIPEAVGQLAHLQDLDLAGNDLSGRLADTLIRQWLSGSLWIAAEAPLLTDGSEVDYESAATALLCGRHRVVLRSDGSARLYTKRCRNISPKDRRTFCEVQAGRVRDDEFAKLAWALDKNGYFGLQAKYDRNVTHGSFLSTRVIWGGKKYEVVEYAGSGPIELWMIHHAVEGASSLIEWEKSETLPECPHWDKSQAPIPH